MCWKERQATPPRSSPASSGTTISARVAIVDRGESVNATTRDLPRYRSTAAIVSSDSPFAEMATTSRSGDGGQPIVDEAYSATASMPAARSLSAATPAA